VAPAEARRPLPETTDTTLFQHNRVEISVHTVNIVVEDISAATSVASVTESAIAESVSIASAAESAIAKAKARRGAAKARRGAAKARDATAAAWHHFRPPRFPGQTPLTINTGATFPIHRFFHWGEHCRRL
jgi:hypothetical protein